MNLILHIVRKDLVRLRGWIACWLGVLLLPIVIGFRLLAHDPFTGEDWNLPNTITILTVLELLVGYILTVLLVQEDGIVGTQQFWLTRPISRGRLLMAKMVGAFAMVGLIPLLIVLPWWLWCGFGVGQIVHAAVETVAVLSLAIIAGAFIAVLTDSLSRAMLWTLVLVAALIFGMPLLFSIAGIAQVRSGQEMSLMISRVAVTIVALAVEFVIVIVVQFMIRRRGWWLGLAAVVVAITPVLAMQWPWPWLPEEPLPYHPERAASVTVRWEGMAAQPERSVRVGDSADGREKWRRMNSYFSVSGAPANLAVYGMTAYQVWRWPDTTIERQGPLERGANASSAFGLTWETTDADTRRWREEQELRQRARDGALPLRTPKEGEVFVSASEHVRPSHVARMPVDPPRFEARLWLATVRPEILLEVPLRPSGWMARHGHGLRIARVDRADTRVGVVGVFTQPVLLSGLLAKEADGGQWWHSLWSDHRPVILLNRERKECDAFTWEKPREVIIHGVQVSWRQMTAYVPNFLRDGRWKYHTDWADTAKVGVTTAEVEAIFSREVKVDALQLER